MFQRHAVYTTRNFVMLALCASVLVAAVGIRALGAPVVRDPENPAFVGNTLGSSTTTTSGQPMRDPENPHWNGSTTTDTGSAGANGRVTDQTGYRGATQGLR